MASAGTLISDLDGKLPGTETDGDLVQQILADMNMSGSRNPIQSQATNISPAPSGRVISSPNPNSTYPIASDNAPPTAHIIGNSYPTQADFANLMHAPYQQGPSVGAPYTMNQPVVSPSLLPPPVSKGSFTENIMQQMKQPLLVAIIFFAISLPVINVMIGHYLPSLLRAGGDLTTLGLLVKSALGGILFWVIQKVLVPLVA
jgi:hypothetical protein